MTNERLRKLCVENGWFTCGTNCQYEKLFTANQYGAPIEELVTIIWLCSDGDVYKEDIEKALREEEITSKCESTCTVKDDVRHLIDAAEPIRQILDELEPCCEVRITRQKVDVIITQDWSFEIN